MVGPNMILHHLAMVIFVAPFFLRPHDLLIVLWSPLHKVSGRRHLRLSLPGMWSSVNCRFSRISAIFLVGPFVTSLSSFDFHPSIPSPKTFLERSYAPYGRPMPDPGYGIDALLDDMSDEEAREWRRHNIHSTCARFRVEAGKSCVFPSTAALERVVFPEHFSDLGTEAK